MNQWIKTQWINFARWPRIIEMWAKSLNKWESSDTFNNNASRLFKAIWDESVTKICMDKSHSKSSTLPVISGDAWRMMRVTQCYMCVCEGIPPPVVRNNLGLWLDSSIWKSLAGGSERDIQMVSLLTKEIYWWYHCWLQTRIVATKRNTSDAIKKEKWEAKITLKREATCVDGNHCDGFCKENMSIQRARKIVPTMGQLIGNNQLLRCISAKLWNKSMW